MTKKKKAEYRYYEMPANSHILALQGERWILAYGVGADCLHLHNYMEIGYCYHGTGELVLEDTAFTYKENTFSLIPSGVLHNTISTPGTISRWEYLFLDVEGYVEELFKGKSHYKSRLLARIHARPWYLTCKEAPVIGELVRNILLEMENREEYYKEKVTGCVIQLLVEIARINEAEIPSVKPRERKNELLKEAFDYIHFHYDEPIRVEELAAMCCISENHFRRLFVEMAHATPVEYLNLTRIHAACDMLKKTEDSIMDIAKKVGFSTLSTFHRNFKRLVGTTPYEWRTRPENYEQKLLGYEIKREEGW